VNGKSSQPPSAVCRKTICVGFFSEYMSLQ
jgi:hypothetical protein